MSTHHFSTAFMIIVLSSLSVSSLTVSTSPHHTRQEHTKLILIVSLFRSLIEIFNCPTDKCTYMYLCFVSRLFNCVYLCCISVVFCSLSQVKYCTVLALHKLQNQSLTHCTCCARHDRFDTPKSIHSYGIYLLLLYFQICLTVAIS